jgi:hypothetical protein
MFEAGSLPARLYGSNVVVVLLGQTLVLTVLALVLGARFQSGTTFLLPVLVLVAPAFGFGYRRENPSVLLVTNPLLVCYSQFLLGNVGGGPGTPALYALVYALVGLALTVPPFALGYATAIGVDRIAASSPGP